MGAATEKILNKIYARLYQFYGPQHWWPGESPLEVIVGAILTQNTNWKNVERAIANLKEAQVLSIKKLHDLPTHQLAMLIKPAGFFNVKAKRLKNFMCFFVNKYQGSVKKMAKVELVLLREELLSVNGIGPETADSILLYALLKPTFVIDAYTKRILSRHYIVSKDANYKQMQQLFLQHQRVDEGLFNEYHALIVRVAKDYCRVMPVCAGCPLEGVTDG